jgi:hypothetical protein
MRDERKKVQEKLKPMQNVVIMVFNCTLRVRAARMQK